MAKKKEVNIGSVDLFEEAEAADGIVKAPKEEPIKALTANDRLRAATNALFCNREYIYSMTREGRKDVSFMINRRLAIAFPSHVQVFNSIGINQSDVMEYWSDKMCSFGAVPGWFYAKPDDAVIISTGEKQRRITGPEKKEFMNRYNVSSRDFDSAAKLFRAELIADIEQMQQLKKEEEENEKARNNGGY